MDSVFQITTIEQLNKMLKNKKMFFNEIEFERGLGIIEDSFYLTIKDDSSTIVIRILTNARMIYKKRLVFRYHDLFLNMNNKKMKRKEYQSQKDIENSLLHSEIKKANDLLVGVKIKTMVFNYVGDLNVCFENGTKLVCCNDIDLKQNNRPIYEIIQIEQGQISGLLISEFEDSIKLIHKNNVRLLEGKSNRGYRFIFTDNDN